MNQSARVVVSAAVLVAVFALGIAIGARWRVTASGVLVGAAEECPVTFRSFYEQPYMIGVAKWHVFGTNHGKLLRDVRVTCENKSRGKSKTLDFTAWVPEQEIDFSLNGWEFWPGDTVAVSAEGFSPTRYSLQH